MARPGDVEEAQHGGVGRAVDAQAPAPLESRHSAAGARPEGAVDRHTEAAAAQGELEPAHAGPLGADGERARGGALGREPAAQPRTQRPRRHPGRPHAEAALRPAHGGAGLGPVAAVDRDRLPAPRERPLERADLGAVGAEAQHPVPPAAGGRRAGQAADRQAEPPEQRAVHRAVHAKAEAPLEAHHRAPRPPAEGAVHRDPEAAGAELALQRTHGRPARADREHPRLRRRRPGGRGGAVGRLGGGDGDQQDGGGQRRMADGAREHGSGSSPVPVAPLPGRGSGDGRGGGFGVWPLGGGLPAGRGKQGRDRSGREGRGGHQGPAGAELLQPRGA